MYGVIIVHMFHSRIIINKHNNLHKSTCCDKNDPAGNTCMPTRPPPPLIYVRHRPGRDRRKGPSRGNNHGRHRAATWHTAQPLARPGRHSHVHDVALAR